MPAAATELKVSKFNNGFVGAEKILQKSFYNIEKIISLFNNLVIIYFEVGANILQKLVLMQTSILIFINLQFQK